MAGDNDRNRIRADGLTDGPGLIRLSDLAGNLPVRGHLPMPYVEQFIVDLALEIRRHTRKVERQVERRPLLGEVGLELSNSLAKLRWPRFGRVGVTLARKRSELDAAHAVR